MIPRGSASSPIGWIRQFAVGMILIAGLTAAAASIYAQSPASSRPGALADERATHLMYTLTRGSPADIRHAMGEIIAAADARFIAVFVEILRAIQLGLLPRECYEPGLTAMALLSGKSFHEDWAAWVEWYGSTDLAPPPGFTSWKGGLLARIDPRFADFLKDDHPSTIRVEEIQWGGVVVDGIPALDRSAMIPAMEAAYLEESDLVFGLKVNSDARAYPLRIMDWHEMANDVVGGVPVSLAYCTLCGAAIAYDGRASDGHTYTFGSSGFLYRSNKLMYDRQTHTLWNQFTGEPVLGKLAGGGSAPPPTLKLLPVVLTTWADWKRRHPETVVLDVNTGYRRPYHPGAPYGDYFSSSTTMFPVWQRRTLLKTKAWVYGLRINGVPKAYPLRVLVKEPVINDVLAGRQVVIVGTGSILTVEGTHRIAGKVTYRNGGEVRAYDRGEYAFRPGERRGVLLDAAGRPWRITEDALVGPEGERAPRIAGHLAYWFGWYTFFPNTLLHGNPDKG